MSGYDASRPNRQVRDTEKWSPIPVTSFCQGKAVITELARKKMKLQKIPYSVPSTISLLLWIILILGDFKNTLGINWKIATILILPFSFVVLATLTILINTIAFKSKEIARDTPQNEAMITGLFLSGVFTCLVAETNAYVYLRHHFQIFPTFIESLIMFPSWAFFSFVSYRLLFSKRKKR